MNLTDTRESLLEDIKVQFLNLYDFPAEFEISLLKYSENIIYKIEAEAVNPVVFRIHRPDYHDLKELESELIWMEEIGRDTDIKLPLIYRGRNGNVLQKMTASSGKDLYCSVISFLQGKILGALSGEELRKAVEQMGEITAKLHLQAIHRDKSVVLKRFSWDIHNFFDQDGVWGSWRDYPGIGEQDYALLEFCQEKMTEKLENYGRSNDHYGLIHADLHFFNIIQNQNVNQVFDFDDSGYGFYLYDLGCTLVTHSQNLDLLSKSWVRGYEKYRKLSAEDKEMIPMFVLLRRIVRLAWLSSHWDSDTNKMVGPEYLAITLEMARDWMMGDK